MIVQNKILKFLSLFNLKNKIINKLHKSKEANLNQILSYFSKLQLFKQKNNEFDSLISDIFQLKNINRDQNIMNPELINLDDKQIHNIKMLDDYTTKQTKYQNYYALFKKSEEVLMKSIFTFNNELFEFSRDIKYFSGRIFEESHNLGTLLSFQNFFEKSYQINLIKNGK